MRKILLGLMFAASWTVSAHSDPAGYGTIIHADGSMTAIYTVRTVGRSYVAHFDKNGNMQGGCTRESVAAFQARKAYMKAKSKWRAGYVPRTHRCFH